MLVEDGSTLQFGIGRIPDAVLRYLGNHKDLGVHSEMVGDGIIDLMKRGIINNSRKTFHKGKDNHHVLSGQPAAVRFRQQPSYRVLSFGARQLPVRIARNDNMVSINSAIEVDLTGQVVADSLGYNFTAASAVRWISSAVQR